MSESDRVDHLPLRSLGFANTPAVPFWPNPLNILSTLLLLGVRALETEPAKRGLSVPYTIDGQTHPAYDFLYGEATSLTEAIKSLERKLATDWDAFRKSLADGSVLHSAQPAAPSTSSPLTDLPLDEPEQFALSWTTYDGVYESSKPLVPTLASWLTDADAATEHFWPTIATFGLAYNLLILQKVGSAERDELAPIFGDVWASEDLDALCAEGRLYAIDLRIFDTLEHQSVNGQVRFTPGTITLLEQDPQSKTLTPIAIRVAGGGATRIYRRTDPAWLYALQAAKTSITVYGVWLGHVYHWHIVTAAMQMAMYNTIPSGHRLRPLLFPQSEFLIEFDDVLLLLWSHIAPPTSITDPFQFVSLVDRFAAGRTFFEDDPTTTVQQLGLSKADFSVQSDWDAYPIVKFLFDLWSATEEYVTAVIDELYEDDEAVAQDTALQSWIAACGDEAEGNVGGLPTTVDTRNVLIGVLTSLLYRVTAHGVSRLNPSANPILTFVADFPPCLQDATLPDPQEAVTTEQLLARLPYTGTIGMMTTFYFTFVFSAPYVPFIPSGGPGADLYFPGGESSPCNQALIKYRVAVLELIGAYFVAWQEALSALHGEPSRASGDSPDGSALAHQWPRNIET